MIEVKYSGHWLTMVAPLGVDVVGVLDLLGGSHGAVQQGGQFGQPRKIVHETGASLHFGSEREDQPVVVNLSGETCDHHFGDGLEWVGKLGARVTRVDLAADVGPEDQARGRLKEMVSTWKRGRVETSMRRTSHALIRSDRPGEGWTAYFGGKSADLQLRCYDKRGPLRLEAQWRPPKLQAGSVASEIKTRGVASCWRSLFKSAVWPMPWYQHLLAGDAMVKQADEQVSATFWKAVISAQEQIGATLWALHVLGVTMEDLVKDPGDQLRGDVAAKFLRWADEAGPHGYDGDALRSEVKCRLKPKSDLG